MGKKDVKAFTLAEVLITLGIIGVVAAMTLPTLIGNYQKKQVISQLKKAFSEYAQAMQMAQVENGTLDTWPPLAKEQFNNNNLEKAKYFGEKYLFPNIKTLKICIPSSNECWPDDIKNLNNQRINGLVFTNASESAISFITASGYSVYYWLHGTGYGMWYVVDVNGPKNRPNQIGKDIFAFGASWGMPGAKIKPMGISNSTETVYYTREDIITGSNMESNDVRYKCKKESSTYPLGGYCAALIVLDGWEIKPDYPW